MSNYNFMDRSSGKYKVANYHKKILKNSYTVLDIGAGTTDLANFFKFKKYVAVDISENTIEKFKSLGYEAHLCNSKEIGGKFKENSFDCIFISHVIEHMYRDEIIEFIIGAKKILKPNGKIIIIAPSTAAFFFYSEWTHIKPHDYSSLSGLLKDFGFKNIVWNSLNYAMLDVKIEQAAAKSLN